MKLILPQFGQQTGDTVNQQVPTFAAADTKIYQL